MASIRKHGKQWRAEIWRGGVRRSKVLPTKRAAQDWAHEAEFAIDHADKLAAKLTLGEVMTRYAREVSPGKRGHRWEVIRLEKLRRDRLASVRLGDLTAADLADWRDWRLREVSPDSVRREMGLIGSVLSQARREWGLLSVNPMADVRKPKGAPPRTRLPTEAEMARLVENAGGDLTTTTARAVHAFRFACETAMRMGEICGLTWEHVDLERRVAHLPETKNGHPRDVPLTGDAVALLEQLPELSPVFGLSSRQCDALWRKVRDRALVNGLRFHDSRAAALTKLSRQVDVMTLAKISGHRDLRILLNTYYREDAASIARRLG